MCLLHGNKHVFQVVSCSHQKKINVNSTSKATVCALSCVNNNCKQKYAGYLSWNIVSRTVAIDCCMDSTCTINMVQCLPNIKTVIYLRIVYSDPVLGKAHYCFCFYSPFSYFCINVTRDLFRLVYTV